MIKESNNLYVKVILPLKLSGEITYSVPEAMRDKIVRGSKVVVTLINRRYIAVVDSVSDSSDFDPKRVRPVSEFIDEPPVNLSLIEFWKRMADYYMCSIGEVFRAAYSSVSYHKLQKRRDDGKDVTVKKRKTKKSDAVEYKESDSSLQIFNKNLPELSELQFEALNRIKKEHTKEKVVLLNGVTGSGKSEIYFHLIAYYLDSGKDILYMLPEIAVSREISKRLIKVFGERVYIYHSGQTALQKRKVVEIISNSSDDREPIIVLGLRSSIFLPLCNTGLIIVDEEHDSSYKQSDPAPRYNGRDATTLLSSITGAKVVLGSATPSFESLYNVKYGKYSEVLLTERYHGAPDPIIRVVDMAKARKRRGIKGSFSLELLRAIEDRLEKGEQSLIFRSRRAYSPITQCVSCGYIPKCPNCNIHLSYHKFNNSLSCHYCGYHTKSTPECPQCRESMAPLGAGTERIEEELKELFPTANIARFDADTTKDKRDQEKILKEFASGRIDILIGTQMISKGFDFKKLTLTAIIKGESISSSNDFRSDEKALQLIIQLMGRAGRRMNQGEIIIQTSQPEHLLIQQLNPQNREQEEEGAAQLIAKKILTEREEFRYPPFVRMVKITIKDKLSERARNTACSVDKILSGLNVEHSGAIPPPIDKVNNEYLLVIWIKLPRTNQSEKRKHAIYQCIESLNKSIPSTTSIVIDVDPLA